MKVFFLTTNIIFWIILLYYTVLTVVGLFQRKKAKRLNPLAEYPSLDVLIPSHNEEIVMKDTLSAMAKLEYPGNIQIYVLNDNSQDKTGEITEFFANKYAHIHHIEVPESNEPRGKSRVLNYGLSISDGEYFIVYDADNRPNPDAAIRLMEITMNTENAAGAVGCVRTLNDQNNWLTRFIAIEFKTFQLIMQSGRYALHRIGSLPGTNMLLKRSIITDLGAYDPYALAEDAELTIRLSSKGYVIAVDPHSQTWEQEPQTLKALMKQRTRWLQGNLYIMFKFFKEKNWWKKPCIIHLTYYLTIYVIFGGLLLSSNILFILGLFGFINFNSGINYLFFWFLAYLTYTIQLLCAVWYDKKLSAKNVLAASLMYFTYAQLFIFLLVRGLVLMMKDKRNGTVIWDKTERVAIEK